MKKRMTIMLVAVGTLFAAIFGYQMFMASMMKQFLSGNALPPATVTAAKAHLEIWQPQLSAVGTLRAIQGVQITSEVSGIVKAVHFKSGEEVDVGGLLFELDAAEEQAQLAALAASRKLAGINHRRNREQFQIHAVSQAEVDASEAEVSRLKAEEARQQALIDKKRMRAPFAGRLGVISINPGQFINPAEPIVNLQESSRLYVDLNVPQKYLKKLSHGAKLSVISDSGDILDGKITAIDSAVDAATRNIAVEGVIDNVEGLLQPGMFVRVRLETGASENLLTLPQTAVTHNPYGSTIFIAKEVGDAADVKPALVAHQQFVTTGPRRGDQIAILEGISEGDMVVTSGQMKLKNGTPLIIDNSVQPTNDIAPRPQEQ